MRLHTPPPWSMQEGDSRVVLHLRRPTTGRPAQASSPGGAPSPASLPLTGTVPAPRIQLAPAPLQKLAQQAVEKAGAQAAAATGPDGAAPVVRQLPSGRQVVLDRMREVASKMDAAKRAGVPLARSNFMSKLLGVGINVVAVAVAAALTATSFGAGAALLAVASVRLAVAVGDAACAYKTWKEAQETPPRNTLPMGADSIGNACHALFTRAGLPAYRATRLALGTSAFIQLGLAVSGMALGMGPAPTDATGLGLRLASTAVLGLMWRTGNQFNDQLDDANREMRSARREVVRAIWAMQAAEGSQALEPLERAMEQDPALQPFQAQMRTLLLEGAAAARGEAPPDDLAGVRTRQAANLVRDGLSFTSFAGLGVSAVKAVLTA